MKLTKQLLTMFCLAVVCGCAVDNDAAFHYSRTVSIGQEFMDLRKARDHNVISEAEYQFVKQKLLQQLALMPGKK